MNISAPHSVTRAKSRGHFCHACRTGGFDKSDMDVREFPASHNLAMRAWFGGPICNTCTDTYVETAEDGVMEWRDCDQADDGSWWPREDKTMFRGW